MFDISLDLTKYFTLWAIAFISGFLVSLIAIKIIFPKLSPDISLSTISSLIISLTVGIILTILAIYGLFNWLLVYLPG